MYADPISKTRKTYLRMDEAGDKTIIFNARITTLFDNHDRQSEMELDGWIWPTAQVKFGWIIGRTNYVQ